MANKEYGFFITGPTENRLEELKKCIESPAIDIRNYESQQISYLLQTLLLELPTAENFKAQD